MRVDYLPTRFCAQYRTSGDFRLIRHPYKLADVATKCLNA